MNVKQYLKNKEWAWRKMCYADNGKFNSAAEVALADLRTFCNGTKSTFRNDPYETAREIGRQEVFQRIMTFLNVDYSEIYNLNEEMPDE